MYEIKNDSVKFKRLHMELKQLGKQTDYVFQYNKEVLETFENKHSLPSLIW